ncbi:MAG TPA: TadE family protein [Pyrinomonadaceae bacterium]|nr:TadE family protein [Pyrinomonadaceae bacterium]
MREKDFRKNERGTSLAEFAVVATFFFMLIFGVIEFGRLLYTHNALTDAARRGARYAIIHRAEVAQDGAFRVAKCVRNVVMYGETHISAYPACDPPEGQPVLISGIDTANIQVAFDGADLDGNPASPNPYGANLGVATVSITNYNFNLSIPLLHRAITLSAYTTTLPAESAGFEPPDIP